MRRFYLRGTLKKPALSQQAFLNFRKLLRNFGWR